MSSVYTPIFTISIFPRISVFALKQRFNCLSTKSLKPLFADENEWNTTAARTLEFLWQCSIAPGRVHCKKCLSGQNTALPRCKLHIWKLYT